MKTEDNIVDKMAILQALFKSTKAFVEEQPALPSVVAFIHQQTEEEFISIAYEAAAMVLALQDLQKGRTLDTWQYFLDHYAKEHAVQVYIGLGWACGQERLDPSLWIEMLNPLFAWRIWDGYGYYDGFFRKRKVVQGVLPENISQKGLPVYWQGVGRSFWYTCKGNKIKLQKVSTQILPNYQADFWRGIGLATAYVGGQSRKDCQEIWQMAGAYQAQLRAGAVLAIKSRSDANTIVEYTRMVAEEWCKLSIMEIIDQIEDKVLDSTVENAVVYHTWIEKIDEGFDY